MGKFKAGKCPICNKPLQRHDEKRVKLRVARRVVRETHLSCYQNKGGL